MEIPKISDEQLKELYTHIKPVVRYAEVHFGGRKKLERHSEGDPYFIKDVDLRSVAFTWDPVPTTMAAGLIELDQIVTLHTYGYHGFFKPSIAEVLAQIPQKYIGDVVAFETDYQGLAGEYHQGLTRLYRHKTLDEVNEQITRLQQEKATLEEKLQ